MFFKALLSIAHHLLYCGGLLLILCVGAGCEPDSATKKGRAAVTSERVLGAAPRLLARSLRAEVEGYDTVPTASIRVNGQPLLLPRADVVRRLGEPDSVFGLTDDITPCLRATDSAAVFEAYGHAVYLRRGTQLRFMQNRPAGTAFSVEIGGKHIRLGTPLADLQRFFPLSYQHRITESYSRYQSLLIYPPAQLAEEALYEFVLFEGRVVQFKYGINCEYD